jgi:hypothetical protein
VTSLQVVWVIGAQMHQQKRLSRILFELTQLLKLEEGDLENVLTTFDYSELRMICLDSNPQMTPNLLQADSETQHLPTLCIY